MSHFQNQLLAILAPLDFERLQPHLKIVSLEAGKVIAEPKQKLAHVYFPHGGVVSYVVSLSDGAAIETGMVGRDGVVGAGEALDDKLAANKIMVQVAGMASMISAERMRAAAEDSPGIRKVLARFAQFFLAHVQQTAACNANHGVQERMCRWLLRMHELVGTDLPLTQEFLAQMLGVRRSSVSAIASELQEKGLIKYSRGHVRILKIDALHEASCECYGQVRDQYLEMFNDPPGHPSIRVARSS